MSNRALSEADVEQASLGWLSVLGWQVALGPDIAPGTRQWECADYGEVVLERRLRGALSVLNPSLPAEALDDAFRRLTRGLDRGSPQPGLPPDAGERRRD